MFTSSLFRTSLCVWGILCAGNLTLADDFGIQTKVFIGGKAEPHSENVTIFHKGIVYDYGTLPEEICILDTTNGEGRFLLLDPKRKVKTEVDLKTIQSFIKNVQASATQSPSEFIQFLANPKFEGAYDPETKRMEFTSEMMTYRLNTVSAPNKTVANQYYEFSDWFPKLNTLTNPAGMPPFARLYVNRYLNQYELIPKNVTLQLTLKEGQEPLVIRSEHEVFWKLAPADQERLRKTEGMLAAFKQVDHTTYFQGSPPEEK